MQDRFKYKIAIFERYKTEAFEFVEFMEPNDRWLLTPDGDIIHTASSYHIHHNRQNAPENVGRVYEPVFCTGLKDKNGKLIYEGDIVEIWKFCTGERSKRVIVWNEARCGFRLYTIDQYLRGIHNSPQSMVNVTTVEVLGNVYETPELLEE